MADTQVSMPFRMRLHWLGYTEKGSGKGLQFHHSYYFYINSKYCWKAYIFQSIQKDNLKGMDSMRMSTCMIAN